MCRARSGRSIWMAMPILLATCWQDCTARTAGWIPSYAGPFVMYMDRVYLCPTAGENMFDCHIRPTHFRHPSLLQTTLQSLDGNFTWRTRVDDTWAGVVKMDVWSGNQWKENSLLWKVPTAYCSAVRSNFPGLYETFYNKDAWAREPCIFEKGEYRIDNKTINWTLPNFPVMPYGRYRTVNMVWPPKKDKMACFVFEMVILAKIQGGNKSRK